SVDGIGTLGQVFHPHHHLSSGGGIFLPAGADSPGRTSIARTVVPSTFCRGEYTRSVRRLIPLLALVLVAQGTTAAEVQVRPNGDRIDVIATAATLQDVLTRLSQQTGMKVVYDGAPPRALVTVSLVQRTPAEAVLSLFEGLGLNYALSSDRTGTRVEMLIISTATGGASPSRPSSAPF